jgi:hypothetical protein
MSTVSYSTKNNTLVKSTKVSIKRKTQLYYNYKAKATSIHTIIPQPLQSKVEYQFNACKYVKVERIEVYMVKDTCLFTLVAAQSLPFQDPEGYRRSQHLHVMNRCWYLLWAAVLEPITMDYEQWIIYSSSETAIDASFESLQKIFFVVVKQ